MVCIQPFFSFACTFFVISILFCVFHFITFFLVNIYIILFTFSWVICGLVQFFSIIPCWPNSNTISFKKLLKLGKIKMLGIKCSVILRLFVHLHMCVRQTDFVTHQVHPIKEAIWFLHPVHIGWPYTSNRFCTYHRGSPPNVSAGVESNNTDTSALRKEVWEIRPYADHNDETDVVISTDCYRYYWITIGKE